MFKKSLIAALFMAAVSQATVLELVPDLSSDNFDTQTQARLDLLAACSQASAPGAPEGARESICKEMCEVLVGDYPVVEVIQPVLNNLERIGGEESVDTLVKLLDHPNEHIRDDARRALAGNPAPKAGQALAAQLKMRQARDAKTAAGLITALGERGQGANLIAGYLDSQDHSLFAAAAKSLGRIGDDDALRALAARRPKEQGIRLMQINDALFRSNRAAVFQKLYAETEPPEVRAVALLGLAMDGGFDVAVDAMASGNVSLQTAVIEAAVQSRESIFFSLVSANLSTLPSVLQPQALGALEFSGSTVYANSVAQLLASNDVFVQDCASKVLARIGTAESVSALMANGREEALKALGVMNADGVDVQLETIAAAEDDRARANAIKALAMRGRRDLIPTFFIFAGGEWEASPKAAVKAIGELGDFSNLDQLVDLMIAKEASPLSRDILLASVEIMRSSTEGEKAVGILVSKMNGASPRSQANILQALAQTGSVEALQPIFESCKSDDERVRKQGIKLLSGWPNENAIPTMLELAGEQSLPLADHVNLMRGVSRLLAAQKPWLLNKNSAEQALKTCRRDEEITMIQNVIDTQTKK
jgi:HEAT repeat protein